MTAPIATSEIARQAFNYLRLPPIVTYDDEGEIPLAARDGLEQAIRQCLEGGDFGFASKLASLPEATASVADPDMPHAYAKPADLVRIQTVGEPGCEPAWREDETLIRADRTAPLLIRYSCLITIEARMPALFIKAAAARLAADISPPIVKSVRDSERLERLAEDMLAKAKRSHARTASGRRHDGRDTRADWPDEAAR